VSSLELFFADPDRERESVEPAFDDPSSHIFDRLGEPGLGCQLWRRGKNYRTEEFECGATPSAPAEIRSADSSAGVTRARLCSSCFARSSKLRPTRYLSPVEVSNACPKPSQNSGPQ